MKYRKFYSGLAASLVAAGVLTTAFNSRADVSFGLNYEFSGGTPPSSSAGPWVTVSYANIAGGVQLTMSAANLTGNEFIGALFINLNPALNPLNLSITRDTSSGAGNVTTPLVLQFPNGFKADGDGFYDVAFGFQLLPGAGRFGAGDSIVFDITGIPGLTAADFNYTSTPGGGNGVYDAAADILDTGRGGYGSGWIGNSGGNTTGGPVPEPTMMVVLGSFIAFGAYLKRRIV